MPCTCLPFALGKHGLALLKGAPLGGVWRKLLHHRLHRVYAGHVNLQHHCGSEQAYAEPALGAYVQQMHPPAAQMLSHSYGNAKNVNKPVLA